MHPLQEADGRRRLRKRSFGSDQQCKVICSCDALSLRPDVTRLRLSVSPHQQQQAESNGKMNRRFSKPVRGCVSGIKSQTCLIAVRPVSTDVRRAAIQVKGLKQVGSVLG